MKKQVSSPTRSMKIMTESDQKKILLEDAKSDLVSQCARFVEVITKHVDVVLTAKMKEFVTK